MADTMIGEGFVTAPRLFDLSDLNLDASSKVDAAASAGSGGAGDDDDSLEEAGDRDDDDSGAGGGARGVVALEGGGGGGGAKTLKQRFPRAARGIMVARVRSDETPPAMRRVPTALSRPARGRTACRAPASVDEVTETSSARSSRRPRRRAPRPRPGASGLPRGGGPKAPAYDAGRHAVAAVRAAGPDELRVTVLGAATSSRPTRAARPTRTRS